MTDRITNTSISIDEIPEEYREAFLESMKGRGCPVVDGEMRFWLHDYEAFLESWIPPGTAKIVVMGDLHAQWGLFNSFINKKSPDIILQCGDFGFWPRTRRNPTEHLRPKNTRIHWCDGNHEDHVALAERASSGNLAISKKMPNVIYQPRGSVLELPDGRNVLFAGGAFSVDHNHPSRKIGKDYFPDLELLSEQDLAIFPDPDKVQIDIVISHTRPKEFYVKKMPWSQWPKWWDKTPDPSELVLSEIFKRYQPKQWFLGHFHEFDQGEVDGCKWTALADAGSGKRWWIELGE